MLKYAPLEKTKGGWLYAQFCTSKTVTLKNTGASAVSLASPSITPGAGADRYTFSEVSLCGHSLAAGKSCPIYVVLFGDVVGAPSATLKIPNSAAGSPQTVPLSATVTR